MGRRRRAARGLALAGQLCTAAGLAVGARRAQLQGLGGPELARLLEAAVRGEQEPHRLRQTCRQLGINGTIGLEDMDALADAAGRALPWTGFKVSAALIAGSMTEPELLLSQVEFLLKAVHLVIVVRVWPKRNAWMERLRQIEGFDRVRFVEISPGRQSLAETLYPSVTSAKIQDSMLRLGLDIILEESERHMKSVTAADVLVLKTRPDVYLPPRLVKHVLQLDYSMAPEDAGRPFLRRVWAPWFDALQPLYLPDDVFAASALDMWQLCWPPAALRPVPHSMGVAGFHVNRWLVPFLPWHPLLFAYRRNLYDVTQKLLHPQPPSHRGAQGRSQGTLVMELAQEGRLRPEVDAYLLQLLALWYRLVLSYFRVGGPRGTRGTHLLLQANATVRAAGGRVELSGVRPLPSCWGFRPGNTEVVTDSSLSACWGFRTDTSAGLARANANARHFARPVVDVEWARRLLAGEVLDGFSERVAAAAREAVGHVEGKVLHVGTPEGRAAAEHFGRGEEELQTQWCMDFLVEFWQRGRSSYRDICGGHVEADAGLVEQCCFPSGPFCPRWLAIFTMNHVLNMLPVLGTEDSNVELSTAIERTLQEKSLYSRIFEFCDHTAAKRRKRFRLICEGGGGELEAFCVVGRASEQMLQALAPPSEQGAPAQQLWAKVDMRLVL